MLHMRVSIRSLGDSLVRAATTASSLEAEHDKLVIITKTAIPGNTLQSDEDSLTLKELMELCTNLKQRVLDLEKTKDPRQQMKFLSKREGAGVRTREYKKAESGMKDKDKSRKLQVLMEKHNPKAEEVAIDGYTFKLLISKVLFGLEDVTKKERKAIIK
ncbi:hypothetical protein Tco_0567435 [Tanacetum coccineum]